MKPEIPYIEAKRIADEVVEQLRPHCERIEIAGSLRRKKQIVGDIEIVAIAKPYQTGLFEDGIASVVNQWKKVRGELPCKYTQRILPCGIKLDLFFCEPENWGNILLIRTGSAEFSKKFMGIICPRMGYRQDGGFLKYNNKIVPCYEERRLFELMGIEFVEPEKRNL